MRGIIGRDSSLLVKELDSQELALSVELREKEAAERLNDLDGNHAATLIQLRMTSISDFEV